MNRWIVRGVSVLGALVLLSAAAPAFAQSTPEGIGFGKEASQGSSLTLACNQGTQVGGEPQYVCTVGNIAQTPANTTLFFRALTSQQEGDFSLGSYGQAGSSNQSSDDAGTILNGRQGVVINPSPTQQFTSTSETFTISGALPSNTVALTVGQYSPDRTKEYADEGMVLLTPPVGQLPEVPFAVGLPIMGLGLGLLLWRRAQRHPA